jgi:predicted ATP-grasp superfamily ATP-dependent carboligase
VGALFLADGATARIVDISAQWTDPVQSRAFRYGGAARPAMLAPAVTEGLARAIAALVPALGLRGLNSADALVRADGFDLLEINPRPGATLDMYADLPLFAAHVATAQGTRPDTLPEATLGRTLPPGGRAVAVAYARRDMVLPRGFVWPAWTADRQSAGVAIDAGEPFCTTHARAADAGAARALVTARVAAIVELAELAQPEDALA